MPGRHYSASIQLKAVGSMSAGLESSTERTMSTAGRFLTQHEPQYESVVEEPANTRLLESINNVLFLAYDQQTVQQLMTKLGLSSGRALYPGPSFARSFGAIYREHIFEYKRLQHFRQLLPSLLLFTPLDYFRFNPEGYSGDFFQALERLGDVCATEVTVHPLQEVHVFVSDHSPLLGEEALRTLRRIAAGAAEVRLRCIYGCGHEMLGVVTPFLIDTVKLVFNEIQ